MVTQHPVIFDGDFGSDDCLALTALAGNNKSFKLLGVTTVFGNVSRSRATATALDVLGWLGDGHVAVRTGAATPLRGPLMFGDNAFGPAGLGKARLPPAFGAAAQGEAVSWMIDTLRRTPEPVTIFAAGPLTNIAAMLQRAPGVVPKIKAVIAMGGGLKPGPHPQPPGRKGNITTKAEFNFFQDPFAANIVIRSHVPLHLVTMDATQNLTLNALNTQRLLAAAGLDTGGTLSAMMRGPVEKLDREKFGADGPFLHDPTIIAYALQPALFETQTLELRCTEAPDLPAVHGELNIDAVKGGDAIAVMGVKDRGAVMDILLDGFAAARPSAPRILKTRCLAL